VKAKAAKRQKRTQTFTKKYGVWLVLATILFIGIFFRFYQLDALPPGLHPDEAANGQDVFRIFSGDIRALYATNGPRESLFFFFQAAFIKALGNTVLAIRLAPALMGTLAIIAVYYWGKDWFGQRVGLLAAFFLAVNPWVVIISRDGFRASMTPLMVATVAYLGGRAIKTRQMNYFIGTGIFLGLGAYTYTAYQLMLAAVVGLLLYVALFRRQWLKKQKNNMIAAVVAFLIVLSPLIIFSVMNPEAGARAGGTSFLNKSLNKGQPLQTLLDSTQKTLMQYNFVGDENARHNVSGEPYLNTFVGIMFILGVLVALYSLRHARYFAILFIAAAMMLPAALTAEGLPHGLRSIGSAPAVMILAAIGLSYFIGRWYAIFPINSLARNIGLALILLLLSATLVQGYFSYFRAWAGSPATYEAYADDMVAIANHFNGKLSGVGQTEVFMVVDGYSIRTIDYLTRSKAEYSKQKNDAEFGLKYGSGWRRLEWDQVDSVPLTEKPTVFMVQNNEHAQAVLDILKVKYPQGRQNQSRSPDFSDRILFYSFEVNR
jgi:4-amino-4-deoxy-L-arabinose transferase-like glycosyltransferase